MSSLLGACCAPALHAAPQVTGLTSACSLAHRPNPLTHAHPLNLLFAATAHCHLCRTRFCIITDSARHVKMAIVDSKCTPMIAVDDPLLMVNMPKVGDD